MSTDLNIEISQIISLANGNPESILPNLFAKRTSPEQSSSTPEVLQEQSSSTPEVLQTVTSQATPTHFAAPLDTLQPLKKKLKLNNFVPVLKNSRKYLGIKAQELRFRIQGDKVIEFCQDLGLIAKEVTCPCGKLMKLSNNKCGDGFVWKCRHPTGSRPKQTIRKGTFFESSRLGLDDILWVAYMWVYEYSYTSMLHECDHSTTTVNEWCQHCLDICQAALEYKSEPLGGEDKSVEIFEGKFKKGKNEKATSVDNEKWVFCALEQYSSKSILLIVEDKMSQTVMEIFDNYFLPGTTVVSHIWCAFKHMSIEDFNYLTKERSISFYDQVMKSQVDQFEEFKKVSNRPPPGANRWNKLEYGPSFFEKMYRKSLTYAPDAYLAFLKDVALIHKPCDKYEGNLS